MSRVETLKKFIAARPGDPFPRYGLAQEYITPYSPEQNGMIERFFRTLKEECLWQHRFTSCASSK